MDKDLLNIVVATGGWIVAIIALVMGYLERKSYREQDRFGKTLDYFDGGSHRLSIGISMLEGVWMNNPKYHSVLVPLIANQLVYLLLSCGTHDAHNKRNLVRLYMIFNAIPNLQEKYSDRWADVCDAITRKYEGEGKGIPISSVTLKLWARSLGREIFDEGN